MEALGKHLSGPEMRASNRTPICLPAQLMSLRGQQSDLSLGFILFYSREVIHQLDYRHHVSKRLSFCVRSPKRLAPWGSLGWPSFLALFA